MNKIVLGTVLASIVLCQVGLAQTVSRVQPKKMTCQDFLALTDNYKPALLYWVAGSNQGEMKATDELVVDAANPVGLVVEECRKSPKASFVGKVRQLSRFRQLTVVDHGAHRGE